MLCELLHVEGVLVSVLQVAKLGLHNNKFHVSTERSEKLTTLANLFDVNIEREKK